MPLHSIVVTVERIPLGVGGGWDECAAGSPSGQRTTLVSVGKDYPQRVGGTKASVIGGAFIPPFEFRATFAPLTISSSLP